VEDAAVSTTDAQVRKLMAEMRKHGRIGLAAIRTGIDRKTARKYVHANKLPSELASPRDWRTREDPFGQDWAAVVAHLAREPALEAKTLFRTSLDGTSRSLRAGATSNATATSTNVAS
jgi:hypothetical protein